MHLWDVQREDELVSKSKAKISETLKENLDVVSLARNVYDEYLFILQEKDRIEAFLNTKPY
jgi:regulator of sirC expression with transglutaminase-like and TPR domain